MNFSSLLCVWKSKLDRIFKDFSIDLAIFAISISFFNALHFRTHIRQIARISPLKMNIFFWEIIKSTSLSISSHQKRDRNQIGQNNNLFFPSLNANSRWIFISNKQILIYCCKLFAQHFFFVDIRITIEHISPKLSQFKSQLYIDYGYCVRWKTKFTKIWNE